MKARAHARRMALTGCLALGLLGLTRSQDPREERDPATFSAEERQALMMQHLSLMGPGPEHAWLDERAGQATLQMRLWPAKGAEPIVGEGTSEAQLILGGRFLEIRGRTKIMGMESETLQVLGFDRRSGEYTLVAFDSMGTYSISARGRRDEESGNLVLRGEDYDGLARVTQRYEFVLSTPDEDTSVWEIWFTDGMNAPDGERFKQVEVTVRAVD